MRTSRLRRAGGSLLILVCLTVASCLLVLVSGVERGFEQIFETVISDAPSATFAVRLTSPSTSFLDRDATQFPVEVLSTIHELIPSADDIAACSNPTTAMKSQEEVWRSPSVEFVTSNYFSIRGMKIAAGRNFTSLEEERQVPVAVAGAGLISSGMAKVGEVFHSPWTGRDYLVVGALATLVDRYEWENYMLFAPLSLLDYDLIQQSAIAQGYRLPRPFIFPGVELWVHPRPGMVEEAIAEAQGALAPYEFGNRKVKITHFADISQVIYSNVKTHATGGLLIAGLAVLGVAIMSSTNLMLLDVVALRRKIAIKRCVGADKSDIVLEVLARTAGLTLAGTALGLALAFSLRALFEKWFGEAVILVFGSVWKPAALVAAGMALAGTYPAVVSSNLPPAQVVRGDPVWKSGKRFKRIDVRDILAIGAITVGVAGLVVMTGISYLTQQKIHAYLRAVGERLVLIERPSLVADFPTEVQPKATVRLTPSLSDSLPSSVGATRAAWFQYVQSAVALPEDDEVYPASVVACSPSLLALRRLEVSSGRLLVHRDDSTPVCVLGSSIARSLFGSSDPLGRTVYIGSPTPFTVVGVLEPTPRGVLDLSFDREDSIFIPPLSMLLIPDLSDQFCEDSKILLETRADEDPAVLVERTRAYFSSELPAFTPPLVDKYLKSVERMDVLQAKINKVFALTGTLALILAAAGVFTIMTARVTERARDIAIRRAVGASKSGIIKLYLGESLRICLLGACFGFITAQPLLHLLEPSVPLSLGNLLSLAASATAGGIAAAIAGGLHPAISAARKPPAEAVRL